MYPVGIAIFALFVLLLVAAIVLPKLAQSRPALGWAWVDLNTPRVPLRRLAWLAALFTLTLFTHLAARPAAPAAWGGRTSVVARVYYDHPRDIARLSGYDVWEYHNVAAG